MQAALTRAKAILAVGDVSYTGTIPWTFGWINRRALWECIYGGERHDEPAFLGVGYMHTASLAAAGSIQPSISTTRGAGVEIETFTVATVRKHKVRSAPDTAQLTALESPDADWRSLPPVAALVELARSLPDMEPDDGYLVIPPRPGTLASPDAHWRTLVPQGAFAWLSMMISAAIGPRSP